MWASLGLTQQSQVPWLLPMQGQHKVQELMKSFQLTPVAMYLVARYGAKYWLTSVRSVTPEPAHATVCR